jgi:hypothetical protein
LGHERSEIGNGYYFVRCSWLPQRSGKNEYGAGNQFRPLFYTPCPANADLSHKHAHALQRAAASAIMQSSKTVVASLSARHPALQRAAMRMCKD